MKTVSQYCGWSYPGHTSSFLSEFFAVFEKAKTEEQKKKHLVDWIKVNANSPLKIKSLRIMLECMFIPSCKVDLPFGIPSNIAPLHKLPDETGSSIFKTIGSIGYFLKASETFIPEPLKRERKFTQLAENMCESEAMLFFAIKDANTDFIPGLTHELVHSVVPGWIPAPNKAMVVNTAKIEVIQQPKKVETIVAQVVSGLKKDGTPKAKPGPKRKSTSDLSTKN